MFHKGWLSSFPGPVVVGVGRGGGEWVGSVNPTGTHSQPSARLLTAALTQQLTRFPESFAVNCAVLQEGGGFRAEYLIRA